MTTIGIIIQVCYDIAVYPAHYAQIAESHIYYANIWIINNQPCNKDIKATHGGVSHHTIVCVKSTISHTLYTQLSLRIVDNRAQVIPLYQIIKKNIDQYTIIKCRGSILISIQEYSSVSV